MDQDEGMPRRPTFDLHRRDHRLLAALAITIGLIYSTLGIAGRFAGELGSRSLLDGLFGVGFLFIGAVVLVLAIVRSSRWREAAAIAAVGTVGLLTYLRIGIPEERTHLIEYGVVALLIHEFTIERGHSHPARSALVVGVLAGVVDELLQAAIPSRVFDWRDIGFNTIAVTLTIGGRVLIARARGNPSSSAGAVC